MTRKDYIKIAKIIKYSTHNDYDSLLIKDTLVNNLCIILKEDNSLFNSDRFINACE